MPESLHEAGDREAVSAEALAELATLLARGYLRLLARKAPPSTENPAEEVPAAGLDCSAETSVHVDGRLTHGDPP